MTRLGPRQVAPKKPRTLIVGAGLAGLTCADRLRQSDDPSVVFEKSAGLGGRCATRRIDGQPVDHGLAFFHGTDPEFLAALRQTEAAARIEGWPVRVDGNGRPCQPGALRPDVWRLSFREGVTTFAKHLADGLDVRRQTRIVSLGSEAGRWQLDDEHGLRHVGRDLVLALPASQSLDLLAGLGDDPLLPGLRALVAGQFHVRCLTVLAAYPEGTEPPGWDVSYPGESRILHLASHDSSKRSAPKRTVLVYQALPCWSRVHWETLPERFSKEMLNEAGRWFGSWAAAPEIVEIHRWRHAREVGGGCLTQPLRFDWPDGRRLGIAGDGFSPGGGAQSAWRAGRWIAERLLQEQPAPEPR